MNDISKNAGLVQVVEAITDQDLARSSEIRTKVFVEEQQIPMELDRDGLDETGVQVLVTVDERPAATGRMTFERAGQGHLARIAVLQEFRGRGLGRVVVQALEVLAKKRGLTELYLEPHAYLEKFYISLGYRKTADGPMAGAHPLIVMNKTL